MKIQAIFTWALGIQPPLGGEMIDNVTKVMTIEGLLLIGQVWTFEASGTGLGEIYLKVVNLPVVVNYDDPPRYEVIIKPCENDAWDSPLIVLTPEVATDWAKVLKDDHGWQFSV